MLLKFNSFTRVCNGWVVCLLSPLILMLLVFQPVNSAVYRYEGQSGSYTDMYGNYQRSPKAYNLPTTNSGKMKVFNLCKPECNNKCEHTIYESRYNTKGECHECLFKCMSATTAQAKYVGVDFSGSKHRRMLRDDPNSAYSRRLRRKKQKKRKFQRKKSMSLASSSISSVKGDSRQSLMSSYYIS